MPLIGAHVSIFGGIEKAAERAKQQGCEIMQVFVQSPQSFKVPQTTPEEVALFKISLKKYHIKEVYVHTPHLINLASSNNKIRYGSINIIRKNLDRASAFGAKYLMTHLGSYGESNHKIGLQLVIKSITKILENYTGSCNLLLELSAGSGNIIGSSFEEIHKILTDLNHKKLGVCLDTAHIFASGYNLQGRKAIDTMLQEFNKRIGLKQLKLIHLNDSMSPYKSKKDRHADIGDGVIEIENLAYILNHPKLKKVNFILETPGEPNRRLKDIILLKNLRIV